MASNSTTEAVYETEHLRCGCGRFVVRGRIGLHEQGPNRFFRETRIRARWYPLRSRTSFCARGAQLAVLEGNPGAMTGDYTVRLKMPDGYRIAPHWHPNRENVTVIAGIFKVGMGDRFDESKMGGFPAGSFAYLDPDMHHYAMASGEVVVQIHGASPFQINYVNPDDDPSRKR